MSVSTTIFEACVLLYISFYHKTTITLDLLPSCITHLFKLIWSLSLLTFGNMKFVSRSKYEISELIFKINWIVKFDNFWLLAIKREHFMRKDIQNHTGWALLKQYIYLHLSTASSMPLKHGKTSYRVLTFAGCKRRAVCARNKRRKKETKKQKKQWQA